MTQLFILIPVHALGAVPVEVPFDYHVIFPVLIK